MSSASAQCEIALNAHRSQRRSRRPAHLRCLREASTGGRTTCLCLVSYRQPPPWPDKMACVTVQNAFQVVLVFRLGFPEWARRSHLGHHLPWPQARRVYIGDRVFGDALLLVARREDCRSVGRSNIVDLAITRGRVVDLKKELEQLTIAEPGRVEDDLDGFSMGTVAPIGRIRNVAARVSHSSGNDTLELPNEVLHAPKAATSKYGTLLCHFLSCTWSRYAP